MIGKFKSSISMPHQPGFYKYQRNIIMNTRIKYLQTIHIFILEPQMMSHRIIFFTQLQDKKNQNG